MLKAAQLYEDELQEKIIQSWYDQSNMYWNGEAGSSAVELPDNCVDSHNFVSIDKDKVIGYIAYSIDWETMSAQDFGIINFDKGNLQFGRDLKQVIEDLFYKYRMNRISWYCHADNPAIKGYRNFVRLNGGTECGYFHDFTKLCDGKLHDSVMFEIMRSNYLYKKDERLISRMGTHNKEIEEMCQKLKENTML